MMSEKFDPFRISSLDFSNFSNLSWSSSGTKTLDPKILRQITPIGVPRNDDDHDVSVLCHT